MGKLYEGKKILGRMTARLVPPDNTYPDAMCDVIMTEETLYNIEDNFDGTFTYHFKIALEMIVSVNKYISENPFMSEKDSHPSRQAVATIITSFFGILMGVLFYVYSKTGKKETIKTYLKIVYKNIDGEIQTVFLENCSNLKRMINAYNNQDR